MVRYKVKITANAQLGLSKIVENHDNYTMESSLRYINAIRQLCSGLKTMPFRYEKRMINGTNIDPLPIRRIKFFTGLKKLKIWS